MGNKGDEQYLPNIERQRLLSNEKIKYFWDKDEKLLHYKTCTVARHIEDKNLMYSGEYNPSMKQCPVCAMHAYVSAYAKDPESYTAYEKAYKELGMSHRILRRMYIDCDISTRRTSDGIILIHNGEWWKIVKGYEKGHVRLYHNNYYMKDGQKVKCDGYHEQITERNKQNIDNILKQIIGYDYSHHCVNRKPVPKNKSKIYIKPSTKNSLLGRLYIWIGRKMKWTTLYYDQKAVS